MILQVDRMNIEAEDVSEVVRLLEAMKSASDKGRSHMGTVELTISGYDGERALYSITEVRKWFGQLLRAVPDILFFISTDGGTPKLIMLCTVRIEEVPGQGIRIAPDAVERFLKFAFHGINQRMLTSGMDPQGAEAKRLSNSLIHAISR